MYLLLRLFNEHETRSVVEFGSGQTTLLIDRVKKAGTHHVCYEHSPDWHALFAPRLSSCDYRLRPLEKITIEARQVQWYSDVEARNFDLLLIDGPPGTDRFSRFGCVELIRSHLSDDFLIIMDDGDHRGEQDTIAHIVSHTGYRAEIPDEPAARSYNSDGDCRRPFRRGDLLLLIYTSALVIDCYCIVRAGAADGAPNVATRPQ